MKSLVFIRFLGEIPYFLARSHQDGEPESLALEFGSGVIFGVLGTDVPRQFLAPQFGVFSRRYPLVN